MKLIEYPAKASYPRDGNLFLRVSEDEALALIQSLISQIRAGNPNTGRLETFLEDGRDFTIAVHKNVRF